MGHQHRADDFRWLWTARPRRLGLGDLMFVVALAALGCYGVVLVLRADLRNDMRAAFAAASLLLFAMQAAQWHLGGRPMVDPRSTREVLRGILSYLIAMAMLVLLCAAAAMFPAGAAVVVVAMIAVAFYLSSWG